MGRHGLPALAFNLLLAGLASEAAGEPRRAVEPPPAALVFTGVSVGSSYATLYGGVIHAPNGDLWTPGLRLRLGGAAGAYRSDPPEGRRSIAFASGAFLAGYHLRAGGSLTLYGGPEVRHLGRADPPHFRAGTRLGAKGLAEFHLPLGRRLTLKGHASYGSASRLFATGWTVLRHVGGPWQIGPEFAAFAKPGGRDLRLGLAASRRAERSGLGAAAGIARDRAGRLTPYVTLGGDRSF